MCVDATIKRTIYLLSLIFILTSCQTMDKTMDSVTSVFSSDEEDTIEPTKSNADPTAEELYNTGKSYIESQKYKKAIENFEEIERLYPFSKLSSNSQVMVSFAQYKGEDYDDSIATIENFVKLHPAHADVPYMYYLKAINYYERIADIKRDQKITQLALDSLKEIRRRFPNTKYSRDAELKENLVYDHLAGKEVEIGRFYLKKHKYIAAITRFQEVLKKYQTTSHIEEALYRLVESYLSIGLIDEAKKNAAVLGHNYPQSKWYKYAYRLVEKGKNSPSIGKESWFQGLLGSEDNEEMAIKKDGKADSWFKNVLDLF